MNKDSQEEGSERGEQQENENKQNESIEKDNNNAEEGGEQQQEHEEQNENEEEKGQENQEKLDQGNEGTENQEDDIQQTKEEDKRSIYVKNVDYMTSEQELIEFFQDCGKINRVKIPLDKYTGQPKGYAYVEFAEAEAVENAKALTDCLLRGRAITVISKRTNVPAFSTKTRARRPFFNQYRGGYYSYRGPAMFSGRFPGRRRYRPF